MVVDSERVLVSGDVSVAVDRSSSVSLVPGALVGAVRRHHLLLHCSVISVDGSWLSPALLVSLGLVLESLSVLLICLNQLNFFLRTLIIRILILICLLLILHCNLLLSDSMGVRRLERR